MNYIIPLRSRPLRAALILLLLLAGLALPFIGLGNELPGRDEAYQALCVMNYRQSPIAMLTFYVGNLWIGLFGNEILNLRRLMVLCYQLSIAMACGYMYYKLRKPLLCALLFMVLCTAFRYAGMWLYGWDAGAYPSMTLFTLAMLLYVERPSVGRIALVGAAMAVMALSRIPTLAALPFILAFIIYVRRRGDHKEGRWRLVAADCAVGLAAMAAVALLLILLMTGGSLSAYIHAWTPDNIINGHFKLDYVIYRWKELTCNVLTAYFPMVFCFACGCYLTRVKRWRKVNFTVCAVACAAMSFFFLRTYMVREIYAAGLFGSLFWLVALLPLLYNMTHDNTVGSQILPLILIILCSLLAGVGSDGFPERHMAINTLPLLLAYVYCDNYRRVLSSVISMAAISAMAMLATSMTFNINGFEYDYSRKPHLAGIYARKHDASLHMKQFDAIASAIERLRAQNLSCAIIGTQRYAYDYIYSDSTAYSLHHFHFYDRDEEVTLVSGILGRYDYALLLLDAAFPANTESYLLSNGCEITERNMHYELIRLSNDSGGNGGDDVACP